MSKKTIIMLAAILTVGSVANVFAADIGDKTWSTMNQEASFGSTGRPKLVIKASTGVKVYLDSITAVGKGYLCASLHNTGTKAYATSSASTKLSMTDLTAAGTAPTTMPAMGVDLAEPSWTGWTTN